MSETSETESNTSESIPGGITIICVLGGIGGVLGFLAGIGTLLVVPLYGIYSLLVSIGQLIVVYGLWTIKPWAWIGGLIVYGLVLFDNFYQLLMGDVSSVITILVTGIILGYIYSKQDLYQDTVG